MKMDEQIKILCVDDEKNVLRAIKRFFLDDVYEIITTTSGKEGLEILRTDSPIQIVISDYRMPEMNGVDFLREVCNGWPETVRIVLSGYADSAAIVGAINEGEIYKFIPKPWNDDDLRMSITNAIERYDLFKKNILLTKELQKKNQELQAINDNLEKTVAERTTELMLRNKVLTVSQNILDSLPVAVLGLDINGLIVHCNQKGKYLFQYTGNGILGKESQEILPPEMNDYIARLLTQKNLSEVLTIQNNRLKTRGSLLSHDNGQEGLVIVFDKEESNG
jgi:two-component system NtrC family sensor kinase